MKKVLSIILIIGGSFAEIFYIIARYKPDGIIIPMCILIGIILNVFLMVAAYNNNKTLMIFLIAFSVLNTSAGQTLSLKKAEVKTVVSVGMDETTRQNARYEKDIDTLDAEIAAISKRLSGFKTMEEKAKYRTNVTADEKALTEKRAEKARLEGLISGNTESKKQEAEKTVQAESIYTFYGSMNKWTSADWLTFALHTIFSIFISIMAPYGIRTLVNDKTVIVETETKNPLVKEKPVKQYQRLKTVTLEIWTLLVWMGERNQPPVLRIPSDDLIKKWCADKGYRFDEPEHAERMEKAKELRLISDTGRLLVSQTKALEAMRTALERTQSVPVEKVPADAQQSLF